MFLSEGLLKLPPKILHTVTDYAIRRLMQKYFIMGEEIKKAKEEIENVKESALNEIQSKLEQITTKTIRNLPVDKKILLWRGPIWIEPTHTGKSYIPYKRMNGTSLVLKKNSDASITIQWYDNDKKLLEQSGKLHRNEMSEFKDFIGGEFKFRFNKQIGRLLQLLEVFNKSIPSNILEKGEQNINTPEKILINLGPEWLEDWNVGGKPLDFTNLIGSKVIVEYPYSEKEFIKTAGTFHPRENEIFRIRILLPSISHYSTAEQIINNFNELKRTVQHEVGHLTQEMLQMVKSGLDREEALLAGHKIGQFGVPSKKLSLKTKDNKYDLSHRSILGSGVEFDDMKDDEFYTYLGEEIDFIAEKMRQIGSAPESERKNLFARLVGLQPFDNARPWLLNLKQHNEAKWKKAATVAYSELKKRGLLS